MVRRCARSLGWTGRGAVSQDGDPELVGDMPAGDPQESRTRSLSSVLDPAHPTPAHTKVRAG